MNQPNALVLVSTSPRRISLLGEVKLSIEVTSPTTDETQKKGETPRALVARLAKEKAESARKAALTRFGECMLIAADTIVVAPDGRTVMGKPKDQKDAFKMIKALAGKTHTVYTGYCLWNVSSKNRDKRVVKVVRSRVKMRNLPSSSIKRYIATGEPLDKAGAYGAQGLGMALIESIEGSYTNVVGLPVTQVLQDLEKLSGVSLYSWIK